jgi:hypothetical protein
MASVKVGILEKDGIEYDIPTEYILQDEDVPFSESGWDSTTVRDAIIESRIVQYNLHFVSGSGLNTSMSNGSFFRVAPSTFSSGSFSGYPAAFPFNAPFDCYLFSAFITFRTASFDFNNTAGNIIFELEAREHVYNGSSVLQGILCSFGNFSGSSTGTGTFRYELLLNDGFSYISGDSKIDKNKLIGYRFVKASGLRAINSFTDVVLTLKYKEVV